ncbi:MAG TPA: cytochrome c [Aquamicrobium sp.]|jgi:mono/diheme cytochrome c family protein|nr:cytochrome c [Aquamicrobium sp.]
MPKMRHFMAAAAFAAFALPAAAQETDPVLAYGKALVEANCAACHGVGPGDESRHAEAPPFRTLWERYPIDALEESFAVGIATGHPDMPEFTATPEQLAAILDYIASLQP